MIYSEKPLRDSFAAKKAILTILFLDQDGAEPCANSVAVCNLSKLFQIVSNKKFIETAEKIISGHAERLSRCFFILEFKLKS